MRKYEKIKNVNEKDIDCILNFMKENKIHPNKFVVLEKIHGANFSFFNKNNNICCASRNRKLNKGDDFYNWEEIYKKYTNKVLKLINHIKNMMDVENVYVYGELFGGFYNGKTEGKIIQKGVQYIPFNDWIIYDIYVSDSTRGFYLGYKNVIDLCNVYKIPVCDILYQGTLLDCINYPDNFITTIPEKYGLPSIKDNVCEGIIIKYLNDDFLFYGRNRPIFKKKNNKFTEKQTIKKQKVISLNKEEQEVYEEIASYINKNRLISVLTKGDVKPEFAQFSKILKLLLNDVLDEYANKNKVTKSILKQIKHYASDVVREYLIEIIR